MLAGVAGGLADYTGVDAVVFRVLFAVLTLFGGAGLLLYLIGWLLLPDEGQESAPVESLLGRGRSSSAIEAALLVVATVVLGLVLIRGDVGDVVLLAVVVVGIVLITRNIDERRRREAYPSGTAPPYPPPSSGPTGPAGAAWAGAGTATATEERPTGGTATAVLPPYPYGYPAPPPGRRPRPAPSILGRVVLSVALIALGVLAALDAGGALDPAPRHYLALGLAVAGAGLLLGAWVGRARWLIAVGVPLTVALVAVSTAEDAFNGGTGARQIHPVTAADLQSGYELGAGGLEMDLSDVDFTERRLSTDVHVGLGNVRVIVPRTVDVTVHATAGLGALDLLGNHAEGTGVERQVFDNGPDGAGGGDLDLMLDVGLGHVEVDRATS